MTTLDSSTLATIGSIIAAFGITMLPFRIQREIEMAKQKEQVWLPVSDWLLIGATLISLLLVVLPISLGLGLKLPSVSAGAAAILVSSYVPAILGHYRVIFPRDFVFWGPLRKGSRTNPEPAELVFVFVGLIAAISVAAVGLLALK